jgi:hypothetical protein
MGFERARQLKKEARSDLQQAIEALHKLMNTDEVSDGQAAMIQGWADQLHGIARGPRRGSRGKDILDLSEAELIALCRRQRNTITKLQESAQRNNQEHGGDIIRMDETRAILKKLLREQLREPQHFCDSCQDAHGYRCPNNRQH